MAKHLNHYSLHVLSGDNSSEEEILKKLIPNITQMRFNQSPEDKLEYIKSLQEQGKKVAMLGDGLNDAGALKQSNIGIAIADDSNSFTPSSDVIMNGEVLTQLQSYFSLTKDAMTIVKMTFIVSLYIQCCRFNDSNFGRNVSAGSSHYYASKLYKRSCIYLIINVVKSDEILLKSQLRQKNLI